MCGVQGQQAHRDVGVPEDIGRTAAHALFEEISRGGICDSAHQVQFERGFTLTCEIVIAEGIFRTTFFLVSRRLLLRLC